jgi:hypothetical protein
MSRSEPIVRHHPVVLEHRARCAADAQLRIADRITAFAGSMPFVYVHAVAFGAWMLLGEPAPWPALTLVCRWRPSSCRPSS